MRSPPYGFARQQCAVDAGGNLHSPAVILVLPVCERDEKTRYRRCPYLFEKLLRVERSRGPSIDPARRRNDCFSRRRASSRLSRMIRPRGTPDSRETSSSHPARSSGSRMVIVLLICSECNACFEGHQGRIIAMVKSSRRSHGVLLSVNNDNAPEGNRSGRLRCDIQAGVPA